MSMKTCLSCANRAHIYCNVLGCTIANPMPCGGEHYIADYTEDGAKICNTCTYFDVGPTVCASRCIKRESGRRATYEGAEACEHYAEPEPGYLSEVDHERYRAYLNSLGEPLPSREDFDKLAGVAVKMLDEFADIAELLRYGTDEDVPAMLIKIRREYEDELAECGVYV